MVKFILGKKIEMSQLFDKDGLVIRVTLIQAGPCFVTQKKTTERDGYEALQIGFGEDKEKRTNKARKGHLAGIRNRESGIKNLKFLREYRIENSELEPGSEIKADIFQEGDTFL